MSLIDLNLTDKERILYYANTVYHGPSNMFLKTNSEESYYSLINESTQLFPNIMKYNIDMIVDFRELLKKIWPEEKAGLLINIIMVVALKNKDAVNLPQPHQSKTEKQAPLVAANKEVLSLTKYVF